MRGQPRKMGSNWIIMIYKVIGEVDTTINIREYPLSGLDTEIPFAEEVITFNTKEDAEAEMEKRGIENISIHQIMVELDG